MNEETINRILELGDVLRRIRKRMRLEGFEIVDGKVVSINAYKKDE